MIEEINKCWLRLGLDDFSSQEKEFLDEKKIYERDFVNLKNYESLILKELKEMYKYWKKLLEERAIEMQRISTRIENISKVLELQSLEKVVDDCTWNSYFCIRKQLSQLEEKAKEKFQAKYDSLTRELSIIWSTLEIDSSAFMSCISDPYCFETIQSLEEEIKRHQAQYSTVKTIHKTMEERSDLVKAMIEFEKSASDPARLFRSSFRLIKEEKFRKTAYPTLLKLEATLRTLVARYHSRTLLS